MLKMCAKMNSDTNDIVIQLSEKIGVPMERNDISISHRNPRARDSVEPAIIVKFVRHEVRIFIVTPSISNISHLTNLDIDLHMPSDIHFDYFTTHDFHSNQDIINYLFSNSLSFLNCNIRSLQANFDNWLICYQNCTFPYL